MYSVKNIAPFLQTLHICVADSTCTLQRSSDLIAPRSHGSFDHGLLNKFLLFPRRHLLKRQIILQVSLPKIHLCIFKKQLSFINCISSEKGILVEDLSSSHAVGIERIRTKMFAVRQD